MIGLTPAALERFATHLDKRRDARGVTAERQRMLPGV